MRDVYSFKIHLLNKINGMYDKQDRELSQKMCNHVPKLVSCSIVQEWVPFTINGITGGDSKYFKCVLGHTEHKMLFMNYFRHVTRYTDLEVTSKVCIKRHILVVTGHSCLISFSCVFPLLPEAQAWDLERNVDVCYWTMSRHKAWLLLH